MSDGKNPRLKSVPGGPTPDAGKSSRPNKVSARTPTAKLPPSPPPIPSNAPTPPTPTPPSPTSAVSPSNNPPQSPSTTAEFAAVHPMLKKQFGRYELLMQMGTGGMASLYLARICGPQKFEKLLAIKKIHDHLLVEKDFVEMFRDEARIAALIHHPNVAATFDLGIIDGSYFIAMEYIHGQTLQDIINASVRVEGDIDWSYIAYLAAEVAKGLHAAHTVTSHSGEPLEVIHRDVSPQNILVSYDGHVKLVDFGIAYAAQKLSHTGVGKLKGKLGYMSPEQVTGKTVDHRSDIFSLGIVLFEMLTMRRLFKDDNDAATIMKVRAAQVPDLQLLCPGCPPELSTLVTKALAQKPEDRFPTAEAFADAIEELLVAVGKRVTRKQISGLMEDLFFERKRIKDRMKRRALMSSTDTPLQGMEAVNDGTASLMLDRMSTGTADGIAPRQSGSSGLLIAGMAGALLVMVILIGWLILKPTSSSTSQEPQKKTAPPTAVVMKSPVTKPPRPLAMRPRPAAAPSVMLTIRVTPKEAKATITFRKEVQQGSIFQAALPTSANREEVTITAPGYQRRIVPIVLSQALSVPVELLLDATSDPPDSMKPDKRRRRRRRRRRRPRTRTRPMSMLLDL
jgi:eukaryotic-like serine/threonine-protein kinase